MSRLLIVHHSPSSSTVDLTNAVVEGANEPTIEGVGITVRPALEATAKDVLASDAIIVGTPANLGYMSGALKHFFDTVYNDCIGQTTSMPYAIYVHGNTDTSGAIASIIPIATGLQWRSAAEPLSLIGPLGPDDYAAAWELGATVAASLML